VGEAAPRLRAIAENRRRIIEQPQIGALPIEGAIAGVMVQAHRDRLVLLGMLNCVLIASEPKREQDRTALGSQSPPQNSAYLRGLRPIGQKNRTCIGSHPWRAEARILAEKRAMSGGLKLTQVVEGRLHGDTS
jgi:hypothetical protein